MKIKTSALVRRAIMLLDEDMEELDLAQTYGDPGMELRKLASELTEEALTKTFLEADTELIDESKTLDTSYIVANHDGTADIPLPDDWLRPVEIRINGDKCVLHDYRDPIPVTRDLTLPGARLRHIDGRRALHVDGMGRGGISVEYLPRPDTSGATVWIPAGLVNDTARQLADMVKAIITS